MEAVLVTPLFRISGRTYQVTLQPVEGASRLSVDLIFCKGINPEETDEPLIEDKLVLKVVAIFLGACHGLRI
jgi:hypothetical protein